MSQFSAWVICFGAALVGVAILMPPWSRTLSTPYGGVREFTWGSPIFAGPENYRLFPASNAHPWEVAADLLACEILVVAGACLSLLYLDRTPHGATNPRRGPSPKSAKTYGSVLCAILTPGVGRCSLP